MTNALEDDDLTTKQESEDQNPPTDSQGETSPEEAQPAKTETVPPTGSKSWEHALQQRQEMLKKEKQAREQAESEREEYRKRLEALELEGLTETERYRVEAERAKAEADELKGQLQAEELKKNYRRFLLDREGQSPKTIAFLRRQMEKDVYPIQGQTAEEFEANFNDFASEYEGSATTNTPKPVVSNPAFEPPAEIDITKLSAAEMRKILPKAEES